MTEMKGVKINGVEYNLSAQVEHDAPPKVFHKAFCLETTIESRQGEYEFLRSLSMQPWDYIPASFDYKGERYHGNVFDCETYEEKASITIKLTQESTDRLKKALGILEERRNND